MCIMHDVEELRLSVGKEEVRGAEDDLHDV